jgi:hypothetical protein
MNKNQLFKEVVEEKFCNQIIRSYVVPATKKDIILAKKLHKQGKCKHDIIKDESGYMYDFRNCAICGKGLGTI